MYLHSKDYEFRYTDADFQDIIRPASFLSVMQESACLSAESSVSATKTFNQKT